ncbi:Metal resistance protein YCF1 like [Verticillium longisporum]|nr:Metal resistance protein YCF1 like [Verticillium longisporum]
MATVWLLKKTKPANTLKDWSFYTKQALLVVIMLDVAVQLAIQIASYPNIWYGDFRVYTTFATILALGVILAIQWLEHGRLRNPNGVALLFWLFLLIAFAVKLRSLISQQMYHKNLPYFITYTVGVGLSVVEFLVEWLWPRKTTAYEVLIDEEECPVEYATYLTEEDLWGLAHQDTTKSTGEAFDEAWKRQLENRKGPSLWLALFRAYGLPYAVAALFKLGNDVSHILGDLWKINGQVEVHGTVAYVAQSPWILNATVKENIIFGYRYDSTFYEKTVKACALVDDFAQLPDGDETVVGERGISLSGGQKARVALARAVYARADIYLLDDVLSAVDSHVGKHITENVLGPRGLLNTKTRILATNSIFVLQGAGYITMIKDGQIVEKGTYKQLVAMKGMVSDLIKTAGQESSGPSSSKASSSRSSTTSTTVLEPVTTGQEKDEMEEAQERVPEMEPIKTGASTSAKKRSDSMATLRRASTASFRGPRGKLTDEEVAGSRTRQGKEHTEQGKVKWDVYFEYAKNSNLVAVAVYLIALLASQTANIGGSVWLNIWAEYNQKHHGNPKVGMFIGIYFAFGIGSSLLTVLQTLILWIFCSIEASRKLHERMANAIFRSPMSFFDVTPTGRILNRFSSDIYRVDEVLARTFNMLFVNLARSCFTLAVISVSTPAFIAFIIPLALTYYWIQRYYLRTSRELKRLDSVSRSPIYAHFQESLGGVSTIRAYRQQQRFELENEWRVDSNLKAFYPSISANRWLAVRLEFMGALVILAAAGLAIISVTNHSGLKAGLVGLSMSYALQITTSLNWIVRQTVEVETNIVSVERVLEYARLPAEAPEVIKESRPPVTWPANGSLEFKNYSTRYREGLDLVLKNISLDIKSHEKIGVVGRTGAGKSSLTLALFRIIEPTTGNISIDGLNTSSIGLLDLRRRLAIIPQDAALFEGTVRDNLDPGHVHDDTELWSVLDHARLKDHVDSMEGGLEAKINEGGSNLSQGQRQLVSLARAMLTPSNILVLDEATAAVDVETDAMLQQTLRSPLFANRTIITVAHRINTILDSDRVVVLDKGEVVEFDSPKALLKKQGVFYGLVKQAGLETET